MSTFETTTNLQFEEHEIAVLEAVSKGSIDHRPAQRDIARAVGLSLGVTNAIVKRLAKKGLLTIRRINSRNFHYAVTPTGIEQIAARSYRYLRRTVGHVVRYKELLSDYLQAHAAAGKTQVVLVGESDLAFLVQWCAEHHGLRFEHRPAPARTQITSARVSTAQSASAAATLTILAESTPRQVARDRQSAFKQPQTDRDASQTNNSVWLVDVLVGDGG